MQLAMRLVLYSFGSERVWRLGRLGCMMIGGLTLGFPRLRGAVLSA